jgi:DNA-binding beta-propeller fold protein YncE
VRHLLGTRALAALTVSFALSGLVVGVAAASGDPLAYVTNEQAGTISQVDLTTGTVGAPIYVGSEPDAIAITPDGSTAYVADYGSSEIVPVALATGTVETPILVNDRPNAIAIAPNGKTAYVIADTGREWPIRLSNRQIGNPTQIPTNADSVAISTDGNTAYITDVAAGTVTRLSLLTGGLGQPINLGVSTPDGVAISPDGSTIYVASNSGGTITPVTLATGMPGTAIPAGTQPTAIAISADSSTAYVTNFSAGQITPITLATGTAGTPISVGPQPSAIALVPAGGITTAPGTGGSGTGSGSGASGGANSGSVGNQQLTLTVSGPSGSSSTAQTCRAPGSTVSVRMTRKTLPHGAKLTLSYVTFALGKQLKRVKRLPTTVKLSLRGLRAGANTLTVRAYYSEKLAASARGHKHRKLTVTISKTLKTRITVC